MNLQSKWMTNIKTRKKHKKKSGDKVSPRNARTQSVGITVCVRVLPLSAEVALEERPTQKRDNE